MTGKLSAFFQGKRVFVTGHTGFKGSWLTQMLLLMGAKVSGLALPPDSDPNLFTVLGHEKLVKSYFDDIRDFRKVEGAIREEKPEILIHMAAQPLVRRSYEEPRYTFDTNLMGTVNVLEAVRQVPGIRSVVIITTDKVYENTESGKAFVETDRLGGYDTYSASKACAELAVQSYRLSFFNPQAFGEKHQTLVASARAGNVIGGGDWSEDRLVPDIIRALGRDDKVVLRNPSAVRPWQHVLDPLNGYLMLAKGLYEGRKELADAWNFAPEKGNCITVGELVEKAIAITGHGTYTSKEDSLKHEMKTLMLDATKAKEKLGWRPKIGIDEALDLTFRWYKAFGENADVGKLTDAQIGKYLGG